MVDFLKLLDPVVDLLGARPFVDPKPAVDGLENTALGFKAVTLFYDLLRSSFSCR